MSQVRMNKECVKLPGHPPKLIESMTKKKYDNTKPQ